MKMNGMMMQIRRRECSNFYICSCRKDLIATIFLRIGISCRKSSKVVGLFTFVKPPVVDNVRKYNNEVSVLWFIAAVALEIMGVPFFVFRAKFSSGYSFDF